MRTTKEFRDVLKDKIQEMANIKSSSLVTDISSETKKKFLESLEKQCKQECIKTIKTICKLKAKEHNYILDVDRVTQHLMSGCMLHEYMLTTPTEQLIQSTNGKLRKLVSTEFDSLVLKLPFIKKEEELNALLQDIQAKINAV